MYYPDSTELIFYDDGDDEIYPDTPTSKKRTILKKRNQATQKDLNKQKTSTRIIVPWWKSCCGCSDINQQIKK